MTFNAVPRVFWMFLAGFVFAQAGSAQAEIRWETQLKMAHARAQTEGKLLLLHFYDDNCVWCDRLEKGAFSTPEVAAAIEKSYIPVKIHASQNPTIASTFKVSRFPTDVIVTTQGQALSHSVSPQDTARYVGMLTQQLPTLAGGNQMVAAAATPQNAPSFAAAPVSNPLTSITPTKNAGFAMPPDPGTPATAVSNRREVTAAPPAGPVVSSTRQSDQVELAMEGFCAVTVFEQDRWIEGKSEFGVVHLGMLYLFSDKLAMDKFLANPEPYTPILNGIDVVRFFEEHQITKGNREWGLKDPDHNRMFFFADEAALNHFYNQHTRYTEAAMQVMSKAVTDSNPAK